MKTKIFYALLLAPLAGLLAQPCPNGAQSHYDLHANNILARIQAGGSLFTDYEEGYFRPNPSSNIASTIFSANLWIGGLDPGGNLKLHTPTYNYAMEAGPVLDDNVSPADCGDWDQVFRVTGAEIAAFLSDLPNIKDNPALAIAQHPNIMGWPGRGNPHFLDVHGFELPEAGQGLAPFFENTGDVVYEPLQGDYPAVILPGISPFVPDEIAWTVTNNLVSQPGFPLEIHLTAWAFNCEGEEALKNTVFTFHRIIYRGVEPLTSVYAGMWADFDIGCYTDDFVGTAPDLHALFGYNANAVDGNISCTPNFGAAPPAQSAIFLNKPLEKSMYYANASVNMPPPAITGPVNAPGYYRMLTGLWPDGTPLTAGGSGYDPSNPTPADHFFPGDPANAGEWSMCSAAQPEGDLRTVGSYLLGDLFPGHNEGLIMAWTHHPDVNVPCNLGNMYEEIAEIRAFYDSDFETACTLISSVAEAPAESFRVFPNPATGQMTIDAGGLMIEELSVFSIDGRLVTQMRSLPAGPVQLSVSGWTPGVYAVRVKTGAGVMSERIAVW
jgi:hypothetical protein